jgi:hypothetical protein
MKDLLPCVQDVFEKFGMNKLAYCVVVGNLIEPALDKLAKKFGGRVIGTKNRILYWRAISFTTLRSMK